MKTRRWIITAAMLILLVAFGALTGVFLIGRPIDGSQLSLAVEQEGQTLTVHIATPGSGVAFCGWKVKQRGSDLHITAREVLVSPIHNQGTHTRSVDVTAIETVLVGGRVVWRND